MTDAGAANTAVETDPEQPGEGKPGLQEVSARVLHELSETIVCGAHQVAMESDRWFLTTVRGLDKGVSYTTAAVGRLGRYAVRQSSKLTASWLKKKSQRERIFKMLVREAKRANLSGPQFEIFSEQIATLVELVLQGRISVSDIAFERDERLRPVQQSPNSNGSS